MSYDSSQPFQYPPSQPLPPQKSNTTTILLIIAGGTLVFLLFCGGIMTALLLPAVQAARQAARNMSSSNNLKQIGLALHNYHAVYNSLPPAYLTDSNGNPTVSWRVLLLPYLENAALYEQFDLEQPWNSPTNASLAFQRPVVYESPLWEKLPHDHTSYVAVRDSQSILPTDTAVTFDDVKDGLANTVVAFDLPNHSVVWTAPDDASPDVIYAAFKSNTPMLSALFADGRVMMLTADERSEEAAKAMISRDGGETLVLP